MFSTHLIKTACSGLALALLMAGAASAQSMSSNSASYNAGYGRTAGSENQAVNPSMRDANGNLLIVDGMIQAGAGSYTSTDASGVSSSSFGSLGSTAIGNNLSVVTQGNWNTVIVDSTQINNGNVSAGSDDPHGQ
jgi:holdfast attachment protein HfaA